MIKVCGIRHHGPGSAKSLSRSLNLDPPDIILLECPQDAQPALVYLGKGKLNPPVAILLYHLDHINLATFYPMAAFSPEWNAIRFAHKKDIELRCIDVPSGYKLRKRIDEPKIDLLATDPMTTDPLSIIASLSGYSDSERWWESLFESEDFDPHTFESITHLMRVLRETKTIVDPENDLREAFMRREIRKVVKQGFNNPLVVCGAWHAPALQSFKDYPTREDNALLKGLKKIATRATWVPWSYERLSRESGYGAGVVSPAWYELLFNKKPNKVERFMSKAVRLLRKKGLEASSAHAIEAVKMATHLAALRSLKIPGVEEILDALAAVCWSGEKHQLELIHRRLIIGNKTGRVGKDIPKLPIQVDFENRVKKSRLSKTLETSESMTRVLDLRKGNHLITSRFFHTLVLLGINWTKQLKGSRFKTGSFSEKWKLKWKADFWLRIIRKSQWGNTIDSAAIGFVKNEIQSMNKLPALVTMMDRSIKAGLDDVIPEICQKINSVGATTSDIQLMMEATPALISIIKYGSVRHEDGSLLRHLIKQFIPRICTGLPSASQNLDEDASKVIFDRIIGVHHSIIRYENSGLTSMWFQSMSAVQARQSTSPIIKGLCTRLLWDKGKMSIEDVATGMSYALTTNHLGIESALWLEGFLYGPGIILLHHPQMWQVLNDWVVDLKENDFTAVLPYLRRAFSDYSESERSKLLARLSQNQTTVLEKGTVGENTVMTILPVLKTILDG